LVNRLNTLDINVGNDQIVRFEVESITNLSSFISTKNCFADEISRVLVKVIEALRCYTTTHAGSNGFTEISNKVRNSKEKCSLFLIFLINLKIPIVAQL